MPFAPGNLSETRCRTVFLETSSSFVHSSISLRIRYLVPRTFNPFEVPLALSDVAPGPSQNSSHNSFRPSLSIDEGEGSPEQPVGHHTRCAPIPSEQPRQGSEIVRGDRPVDSLGPWVRSEARICIAHERGGCLRHRCIHGMCRRRQNVSAPSAPDFSLPDRQVSKAILCKCANRCYVGAMNSVLARRSLDGHNRRYPRSKNLDQSIRIGGESRREREDGFCNSSAQR